MAFQQYIFPNLIIKDLKASNKQEAIKTLINKIYEHHPDFAGTVTKDEAFTEAMQREELQSTGLGQGKAFPHVRVNGWKDFVIALAYCKEDLPFESLDNEPVHFICLMISSKEQPYLILKAMSNIIKFLNDIGDIRSIFENKTPLQIAEIFQTKQLTIKKVVEAQDIMRPLKTIANIDDSIEDVVKLMHLKKIDVLPVVDNDKQLIGQLSCFNIFDYEVPEFFKQLNTVSFVRNIDPFEKFFKLQKNLKIKDYLKEDCATVEHNATLIEIIFLLTTKGHPRLFVTKEKKLVGVIDRFCILDRILFF